MESVDEDTKNVEKWRADEIKCQQDFARVASTMDLEAIIRYYRGICSVTPLDSAASPDATHEQFASLIVDKLKLSPTKVIELIELGGPLYPGDIEELYNVRLDLIEKILLCAIANTGALNGAFDLFDALFPLLVYIFPASPQFNQFSWDLCAKVAKATKVAEATKVGNGVLEKLKRSEHWCPSYAVYVRVVQGDYSMFDTLKSGSWKTKDYAAPPGWSLFASTFYEKCGQKCLELCHRPENILLFDEIVRIYGPWGIIRNNFKYLVNCVIDLEKTKQLRFFLTRLAYANSICGTDNRDVVDIPDEVIYYTSFAQLFVDEVKVGDHSHLNTFHSDFENIEALCFDNSTGTGTSIDDNNAISTSNPTKLDKLFPKGLLVADESLLRLLVRNHKFSLNDPERLSRVRLVIDDFHRALLVGKVITPLRELTLYYF